MKPEIAAAAIILAIGAYIDWKDHRVPNWLTFSGWGLGLTFHGLYGGVAGLYGALLGSAAGLATLIIPYALRGMGAGDVKLMAAVGAWVGVSATLHAFLWIGVLGGLMGGYLIVRSGQIAARVRVAARAGKNLFLLQALDTGATEQAPARILLPYGVPIAIGFYVYFIFGGLI